LSADTIDYAPYEYVKEVLLSRGDTSYWLREALHSLDNRDPVDAINDVTLLKTLLQKRLDEVEHQALVMLGSR